jgi:hypothetical protein
MNRRAFFFVKTDSRKKNLALPRFLWYDKEREILGLRCVKGESVWTPLAARGEHIIVGRLG